MGKKRGRGWFPEHENFDRMISRRFKCWGRRKGRTLWYQGEVDKNERPHGRGITIVPGDHLHLGYWKSGEKCGPSISIDVQGEKLDSLKENTMLLTSYS